MKTSVRVEVDEAFYQVLIEEQDKRRHKTGRKIALSTLILEFSAIGSTLFHQNEQNSGDSEQNFGSLEHYSEQNNGKIPPFIGIKDPKTCQLTIEQQYKLHQLEQHLNAKERDIEEKEQEIATRDNDLLARLNSIHIEREKLLDEKERMLDKINEITHLKWLVEKQTTELKSKTDAICKLQQDNATYKEKVIQTLARIEQKTEKNTLMDYIVPFLPSLGVIISYFLLNKKIEGIQQLNPVQEEIKNLFARLPDTSKRQFNALLEEDVKKYSETLGK